MTKSEDNDRDEMYFYHDYDLKLLVLILDTPRVDADVVNGTHNGHDRSLFLSCSFCFSLSVGGADYIEPRFHDSPHQAIELGTSI